jgi:hypothetical protein
MKEEGVRVAHTEALFRDVNERIAESAKRFSPEKMEFVCECADPACAKRVPASLEEYERARADGARFIVVPGHENTRIEHVVERPRPRVAIVEKFNAFVAQRVRQLNPRTESA